MSIRALRPLLRAAAPVRLAVGRRVVASAPAGPSFRTFSVTARRLGSGQTDGELAAALEAEHQYETDAATALDKQAPEFLEKFRAQGVWTIEDTAGMDDVAVARSFGNETLRMTFQVSDLQAEDDPVEATDEEGNAIEEAAPPPYIICSLVITKSIQDALSVDLEATADGFEITNVAVFDKGVALADGAEGSWARQSRYMGPQFDTLDSSVQDAFASFLAERGVDDALASFVVAYAEYKEQKDYVSWLASVKAFVEQ